jgi:hypothetical protein
MAMIAALDSIKAAFGPQARPIAALRNAGLDLINAVGPVRDRIMKYAMPWDCEKQASEGRSSCRVDFYILKSVLLLLRSPHSLAIYGKG